MLTYGFEVHHWLQVMESILLRIVVRYVTSNPTSLTRVSLTYLAVLKQLMLKDIVLGR